MGVEKRGILKKIISWIDSEEVIRLALLTGSFADRSVTDELSDYDISLFCSDPRELIESDSWIKDIGDVWVVVPEKYHLLEATIPTRLVIFQGGKKVDFSFFSQDQLDILDTEGLPDAFHMGYEVLVDKDRLANKLPLPKFTGFREARPSEEEFHSLINEFWFEAYHVAKYLYRRDLWSVQFRLSGIYHSVLIKMICWNEAARHNWEYTTHPNGKQLKNWVGKDTWTAIHHIFPHFDAKEGWQSLRELLQLFIKLSHETSKFLGYRNLTDLETEMDLFITELEAKQMQ
ncbi:MAG: hypothetical protein Tsb0015_03190 [Simkaniaceae bacterium]